MNTQILNTPVLYIALSIGVAHIIGVLTKTDESKMNVLMAVAPLSLIAYNNKKI